MSDDVALAQRNKADDMSMDEILASIRRIISEEEKSLKKQDTEVVSREIHPQHQNVIEARIRMQQQRNLQQDRAMFEQQENQKNFPNINDTISQAQMSAKEQLESLTRNVNSLASDIQKMQEHKTVPTQQAKENYTKQEAYRTILKQADEALAMQKQTNVNQSHIDNYQNEENIHSSKQHDQDYFDETNSAIENVRKQMLTERELIRKAEQDIQQKRLAAEELQDESLEFPKMSLAQMQEFDRDIRTPFIDKSEIPSFLKEFRKEQLQQQTAVKQNNSSYDDSTSEEETLSFDLKALTQTPGYNDEPAILNLTQAINPDGQLVNLNFKNVYSTSPSDIRPYNNTNSARTESIYNTQKSIQEPRVDLNDNDDDNIGNGALEILAIKSMRPMIQDWINLHLESIVEKIVREELRKR